MRNADHKASVPWYFRIWVVSALLTCPCHLPFVLILLSGTALGAWANANTALAAVASLMLFALFVYLAMRSLRGRDDDRTAP